MNGVTNNTGFVQSHPEAASECGARAIRPFQAFFGIVGILTICFAKPIYDVARLSLAEGIHSHILLIPFISAYLVWLRRTELPKPQTGSRPVAWVILSLAAMALAGPFFIADAQPSDLLALRMLGYWFSLLSASIWILGTRFTGAIAFPIGFLLFAIPLPQSVINALEIAFQHASAEVYSWALQISRVTFYREGTLFLLPNLPLQIAQECSGIRSNLALFMTSLLAGEMLLRSPKKRLILALTIFPLGILRNAFRVYVLSMLAVHWNRDVLDSPLHHRGGPLFFAISLVPLFFFLVWLRRSESKGASRNLPPKDSAHTANSTTLP